MCVFRVGGFRVQAVAVSELLGVFRLVLKVMVKAQRELGPDLRPWI